MELIDGKAIAKTICSNISEELGELIRQTGTPPVLCDVMVGDDPVSISYVRIKARTAESLGFKFRLEQLPLSATTDDVISEILRVQQDSALCGLIVQLPLPDQVDKKKVLEAIDPQVDVDCIGPVMASAFYEGRSVIVPPTAGAILSILESLPVTLSDKTILVIGQGELVGRPITFLLQHAGYTVVTADKFTADLPFLTQVADIVITGVGQPNLVTQDMVKDGVILIDAATSESGSNIVGDVDLSSVASKASYISPVPGGVGPVTVAKLLENVFIVAKNKL